MPASLFPGAPPLPPPHETPPQGRTAGHKLTIANAWHKAGTKGLDDNCFKPPEFLPGESTPLGPIGSHRSIPCPRFVEVSFDVGGIFGFGSTEPLR